MAASKNIVDMDQDMAQVLFREGAILAFLDVPEATEFGIDYNCWRVGPKFKGVKMIPPGIHFIYYSATNKERQSAPRTGFFYNFKPKEVLIKKWDKFTEDICAAPVSSEDQDRIEQNKEELDKFLGAYPYQSYKKWISLTNQITPKLLNALQPTSGRICSVTEFESPASNTQQRREAKTLREAAMSTDQPEKETCDKDGLPELRLVPGMAIRFSEIPQQKWPDGATPMEITKYSMDHSYVLENILKSEALEDNNFAILGEMQFAFICFLIGQVYDGFEQWKRLVHVLCHSDEALSKHSAMYDQFITTLHFHVREIPEDFFVDIISRNNFLTTTLHDFFANLANLEGDEEEIQNLKKKGDNFKKHLEKKFGWDFTSEDDEYAPVVVDL